MGFNSGFKGLTAIGEQPDGSSSVHIYTHTQTSQRTTQNKQYIEKHKST